MLNTLPSEIKIQPYCFTMVDENKCLPLIRMTIENLNGKEIWIRQKQLEGRDITILELYQCIYMQYLFSRDSKIRREFLQFRQDYIYFTFKFPKSRIKNLPIQIDISQNTSSNEQIDYQRHALINMQQLFIKFEQRIDLKIQSACEKLQQRLNKAFQAIQQQSKKICCGIESFCENKREEIEKITSCIQSKIEKNFRELHRKQIIEMDFFKAGLSSHIRTFESNIKEILNRLEDLDLESLETKDNVHSIFNQLQTLSCDLQALQNTKCKQETHNIHLSDYVLAQKWNINQLDIKSSSQTEENLCSKSNSSAKNSKASSDKQFDFVDSQKPFISQLTTYTHPINR